MVIFINLDLWIYIYRSKIIWIDRIDKVMITNIKKLLKLTIRTNNNKLKIAFGLPNLNTYVICRSLKLKEKYEYIFNEKINYVL